MSKYEMYQQFDKWYRIQAIIILPKYWGENEATHIIMRVGSHYNVSCVNDIQFFRCSNTLYVVKKWDLYIYFTSKGVHSILLYCITSSAFFIPNFS